MNWEYIWECMKIQIIGELGWDIVMILAIFLLSAATILFIKTTEGKGNKNRNAKR